MKHPVIIDNHVIDAGDTLELIEDSSAEILESLGSKLFLAKQTFKLTDTITITRGDKFRVWPNQENRQ